MEQYIEPFIAACTVVFKNLLGYDLEAEYPFFITRDKAKEWDLSALISISGEARGLVALSLKSEPALVITDKLTGTKHSYLDEEVVDAIGEVVNIIAGNVTQRLEDEFNLIISLPRIIKGKGHEILWAGTTNRILCVPFKMPDNYQLSLLMSISSEPGSKPGL
jgi:chemotaxis protein CheX